MDVCLISQNTELHKLCSEVLEELFGNNISFHADADCRSRSDIYIRDFHPNMLFPGDLDWRQKQKHFFLLHRRQMAVFSQKAPSPDVNLLLKPVPRATLKAFLANSLETVPDRAAGQQLKSIRADRDEMLQCLIQTNLKLQEYDHERTNFLARAIHDFRAPLTALCGYCKSCTPPRSNSCRAFPSPVPTARSPAPSGVVRCRRHSRKLPPREHSWAEPPALRQLLPRWGWNCQRPRSSHLGTNRGQGPGICKGTVAGH